MFFLRRRVAPLAAMHQWQGFGFVVDAVLWPLVSFPSFFFFSSFVSSELCILGVVVAL